MFNKSMSKKAKIFIFLICLSIFLVAYLVLTSKEITILTEIKDQVPKINKEVKVDLENIVYFDKWGNEYMEPETKISSDAL